MNFDENVNCNTCKHGYFNGISLDGDHNLCGASHCYLCAQKYKHCSLYEAGDVPDDKEPM